MDQAALAMRVDRLERANRRLTALVAAMTLALVAGILMAMTQQPQGRTIEVDEVVAKRVRVSESVKVTSPTMACSASVTPTSIGIEMGQFRVAMGVCGTNAGEKSSVGVGLQVEGPPRPGAKRPGMEGLPPDVRDYLARLPFRQTRAILSTSEEGTTLSITDPMDRLRAQLGAQVLGDPTTRRSTRHPESTLTLWDETGELRTFLHDRR